VAQTQDNCTFPPKLLAAVDRFDAAYAEVAGGPRRRRREA
jgi:hypothetical protein